MEITYNIHLNVFNDIDRYMIILVYIIQCLTDSFILIFSQNLNKTTCLKKIYNIPFHAFCRGRV